MSAAAASTSRLANSPASGGDFDRPQVAITIGLEWRLPPARADLSDPAPRRPADRFRCRLRELAGIDLGRELVPDETTILNFRHLLERHGLGKTLFERVNEYLPRAD